MFGTGSNLLSVRQLDRGNLETLFGLARLMEPVARGEQRCTALSGAILGSLFFEPSTRSRISFGSAFARLGGHVLDTTGVGTTSIAKGESIEDTARVVSGYVDAVVLRHPTAGSAQAFASAALVPVVNGGDGDGEHPTQCLTDLYTMHKELAARGKTLDGSRIAILGDLRFGRTVHSLIIGLALYQSLEIVLLSPDGLELPRFYFDHARARGHRLQVARTLEEALSGADILYATRYQSERYGDLLDQSLDTRPFHLDRDAFSRFAPADAVIMHPLPRDSRAGELDADLDILPNLAVFRQTDNGVPVRMALFATIFGLTRAQIEAAKTPTPWSLRRGQASTAPPEIT